MKTSGALFKFSFFLLGIVLTVSAYIFSSFFGTIPLAATTFASISFLVCLLVFSFIIGPFSRRRLLTFSSGTFALICARIFLVFQSSFSYLDSCLGTVGQCTLSSRYVFTWWTIAVLVIAGFLALFSSFLLLIDTQQETPSRLLNIPFAVRLSLLVFSLLAMALLCAFSNPYVSVVSVLFYPLELLLAVLLFQDARKGFNWFKYFIIVVTVIMLVGCSLDDISWLYPLPSTGAISPEYYAQNPDLLYVLTMVFVYCLMPLSAIGLLVFGIIDFKKKNRKKSPTQKSE